VRREQGCWQRRRGMATSERPSGASVTAGARGCAGQPALALRRSGRAAARRGPRRRCPLDREAGGASPAGCSGSRDDRRRWEEGAAIDGWKGGGEERRSARQSEDARQVDVPIRYAEGPCRLVADHGGSRSAGAGSWQRGRRDRWTGRKGLSLGYTGTHEAVMARA
jgi:hypothetical protein